MKKRPTKGKRKKKASKGRRPRSAVGRRAIPAVAAMLADPCNAKLVTGLYDTTQGYLQRLTDQFAAVDTAGTATCGYVLWFPNYNSAGAAGGGGGAASLFTLVDTDSSNRPTQGGGTPFAGAAPGTAARASSRADPANAFVAGNLVDDARNLADCVRMAYVGPMTSTQGQVCFLNNIPLDTVYTHNAGGVSASVDDLFMASGTALPLGKDAMENRYQPIDRGAGRFFDQHIGAVTVPTDVSGAVSADSDDARMYQPTGFGFAFRGLAAGQVRLLRFELTKIIEWKIARAQGMPLTKTITNQGGGKKASALHWLSRWAGRWYNSIVNSDQEEIAKRLYTASSAIKNIVGAGKTLGTILAAGV